MLRRSLLFVKAHLLLEKAVERFLHLPFSLLSFPAPHTHPQRKSRMESCEPALNSVSEMAAAPPAELASQPGVLGGCVPAGEAHRCPSPFESRPSREEVSHLKKVRHSPSSDMEGQHSLADEIAAQEALVARLRQQKALRDRLLLEIRSAMRVVEDDIRADPGSHDRYPSLGELPRTGSSAMSSAAQSFGLSDAETSASHNGQESVSSVQVSSNRLDGKVEHDVELIVSKVCAVPLPSPASAVRSNRSRDTHFHDPFLIESKQREVCAVNERDMVARAALFAAVESFRPPLGSGSRRKSQISDREPPSWLHDEPADEDTPGDPAVALGSPVHNLAALHSPNGGLAELIPSDMSEPEYLDDFESESSSSCSTTELPVAAVAHIMLPSLHTNAT